MALPGDYNQNVFLNCPFDRRYRAMLRAIVFAVFDCGFVARSALELVDTGEVRVDKIGRIIDECRYGFHDISRTTLDSRYRLPRFNMPFELGLFLGAARASKATKRPKNCLVVDSERYRYQRFLSDIAGQDIAAHNNEPSTAVSVVRDWLRSSGPRRVTPGGAHIWKRYQEFARELPGIAEDLNVRLSELTFNDYTTFVSEWLIAHEKF